MPDERLEKVVAKARMTLAEVEKTVWGSPAGKKRLAPRLVKMLPAHRIYVEPFVGSAAVLFEKEPAEVEVINDADLEIAKAYKIVQKLTPAKIEALGKKNWTGDKATFKRLVDSTPTGDLDWLYKFLYVTHFSYGKMRGKSFSPSVQGITAKTVRRLEKFAPRLKQVKVYGGDYEKVVKSYDGKDTLFFLDPPYPGYDVDVGESDFDEERFFEVLKGKWLMTYGIRGKLPKLVRSAGFKVKQIRTPRTISNMRGVSGPKVLTQLLVANYDFTAKCEDCQDIDPFELETPILIQKDDDERYVLGVVLVPEEVDAQGDIYSEAEVRQAAHRFMEEFGGLGVMHRVRANHQVKVLETFLAPNDFTSGDTTIKRGTWLMAVRVQSQNLWDQIKAGELSGFSIGGHARREAAR